MSQVLSPKTYVFSYFYSGNEKGHDFLWPFSLYFDAMRKMETEVMVYRCSVELLKQLVKSPQDQEIEALIQKVRTSEDIKQILDEKYERYRRQALECIEQGSQDQALLQYLREWKAKGPTN